MANRIRAFAFAFVTTVAVATSSASAQAVRSVHPAAIPASVAAPGSAAKVPVKLPHPKRLHIVYGSIENVGATTLVLLLRRHKLVDVDITAALADGTFSNPLTVGKFVAVEGEYGAGGVLFASNVTRLTRLDDTTGPDR